MTTLEQIGFTLAGGTTVLFLSVSVFGIAVSHRNPFIANRATARPADTIYTPYPTVASQERGNPWTGWISWTLGLTYDTLLRGVPGTGTREHGLSGSLLRVNLDGIVLLRFHAVCLKVATLATILLVVGVIPSYLTAQCFTDYQLDEGNFISGGSGIVINNISAADSNSSNTSSNASFFSNDTSAIPDFTNSSLVPVAGSCDSTAYNLTNYQRTTLANVPSVTHSQASRSIVTQSDGILWRLYLAVATLWIMAGYLCHNLHQEWVQILAMRRVYYLEYDIWGERREELKQTLLFEEIAAQKRQQRRMEVKRKQQKEHRTGSTSDVYREPSSPSARAAAAKAAAAHDEDDTTEPHLTHRDPWIPHPEQRDTVPNVALYSILVGGLPSLPEQAADSFDARTTIQFSKRESIDWQLSLTTTFFDHCVPNQPGFSSSVAAVTIIPGARDLSVAWRRWYTAASKLRRLRFIREQIRSRRHFDIESSSCDGDEPVDSIDYGYGGESTPRGSQDDDIAKYEYGDVHSPGEPNKKSESTDYGYGSTRGMGDDDDDVYVPIDASDDDVSSYLAAVDKKREHEMKGYGVREDTPRGIYETPLKNKEYYKQVLGSALGTDHDTHIYDSLEFGPEQAAVYAREFAQSAAPCCPHGCNEFRIRHASIDALEAMERKVAIEVHEANLELRDARRRATRADTHSAPQTAEESPPVNYMGGGTMSMAKVDATAAVEGNHGVATNGPAVDNGSGDDMTPLVVDQPMASRYDRRRSNGENLKKAAGSARLNPERLDDLAGLGGDLGLEATLFKKSSTVSNASTPSNTNAQQRSRSEPDGQHLFSSSSMHDSYNLSPQRSSDGSLKKAKLRKTPSLEGVSVPSGLSLEASLLIQDLSHGSTGSQHRRKVKEKNSSLSNIPELDGDSENVWRQSATNSPTDGNSYADEKKMLQPDIELGLKHADALEQEGSTSAHWIQVETIITEARESVRSGGGSAARRTPRNIQSGGWGWPNCQYLFKRTIEWSKNTKKWAKQQSKDAVDNVARESTFAVVTFTSRQAAVAARACLADGRGAGRWNVLQELPIPPLADAAPMDLATFRNCCKPVTLSINERQKNCRNYISIVFLGLLYLFYTIPLTLASSLIEPEAIERIIPGSFEDTDRTEIVGLVRGLVTACIWSGFFALCPILFQSLAHFGSMSTSVANSEFKALQYYWWFMVVTAFSGQLLAQMGINAWNEGLAIGSEFQPILREIGKTVPSTIAVSWLNWIIFRFTIILPLNYLLQINSFLFHFFGLKCCSRLVRGGGPGGPVPYRIYIDSGVVLMCLLALAPASPLVAPACMAYFLFCQPLLRRNLVYMYRPKFDGGGFRWPFIFDMCISGLIVGEILLTVQMALKQATGPTAGAALTLVPTFLFSRNMKKRYLRSFKDAALLQTSLLDGWDTAEEYSIEKREEFRQFLVDAHKAAYVPVCLAGTDTEEFLTAEPAVILEDPMDEVMEMEAAGRPTSPPAISSHLSNESPATIDSQRETSQDFVPLVPMLSTINEKRKTQHGVTLRRAVNTMAMRRRTSSVDASIHLNQLNEEERSGISPFERSMSSKNIALAKQSSFRNRTMSEDVGNSGMFPRETFFRTRTFSGNVSTEDLARSHSHSLERSWQSRSSTVMAGLAGLDEDVSCGRSRVDDGKDD